MKNVVYMKMFYYPCNNKSLAYAVVMKIVINDFGEEKVVGNIGCRGKTRFLLNSCLHGWPSTGDLEYGKKT